MKPRKRIEPCRWLRQVATLVLGLSTLIATASAQTLEAPVCGDDELAFASRFRDMAARVGSGVPTAALATSWAVNGVTLSGYRLPARGRTDGLQPVVYVLQGNAMQAGDVVDAFEPFAAAGYEVHVVDYRGFARSEGRPFLQAIAADAVEVARQLAQRSGGHLYLYGMSFGGGVALRVMARGVPYRAAVIDAAPSTFMTVRPLCLFSIKALSCAAEYQPTSNVPADARNVLYLRGTDDTVVRSCEAEPLPELVRRGGGQAREIEGFKHPLMETPEAVDKRLSIVVQFFRQR